jgi:hypothetical protein
MVSATVPTAINLGFLDRRSFFSQNTSSVIFKRMSGPRSRTHCFSENLLAQGFVPETSGSVARYSDHHTAEGGPCTVTPS